MPIRRRRRGFERAGKLPLDGLGLPGTRARELVLTRVWESVAGPVLAAHARAVRVRRGVLEIEVAHGRWSETLIEMLPGLATRVSRVCPELGVRKFRLRRPDSDQLETAQPIDDQIGNSAPVEPQEPPAPRDRAIEVVEARPLEERLKELARRYVERGVGQNQ